MNKENLKKLADGLEGKLPEGVKFDMSDFGGEYQSQGETCGTAGCALGFASVFVEPRRRHVTGLEWEDDYEGWTEYCKRVLGVYPSDLNWHWLFSSVWANIDNTPKGAAKRIRYVIEHGRPPKWYDDDGKLPMYDDDDGSFLSKYKNWRNRGEKRRSK